MMKSLVKKIPPFGESGGGFVSSLLGRVEQKFCLALLSAGQKGGNLWNRDVRQFLRLKLVQPATINRSGMSAVDLAMHAYRRKPSHRSVGQLDRSRAGGADPRLP